MIKYLTFLTGVDAALRESNVALVCHVMLILYTCLQAELKHKLSERSKLLAEYEVTSFINYT